MTNRISRNCCLIIALFCVALATQAVPPQERVSPKDGAIQVFVPGGDFVMGVDDPTAPMADEQRPPHQVKLTGFWMDKYEVANEQFANYLNALIAEGGKAWSDRQVHATVYGQVLIEHPLSGLTLDLKARKVNVIKGHERFPVFPVSWSAAAEYAKKMGRRLPTEAEWEYAARGADGRRYPWGNEWNPKWANVKSSKPAAVDAFPKDLSPFGIVGLAGNVREWVQDCFGINYYASSPRENPRNDGPSGERVMRGGCFAFTEWDARTTSRYYGTVNDGISPAVGFRTVESVPPPTK